MCRLHHFKLEYVENYVMKSSKNSREMRWVDYFNGEDSGNTMGPLILKCILKENNANGWRSAHDVAKKIVGIYSMASDSAHATSHEINADKATLIRLSDQSGPTTLNVMACIANSLGLTISCPDYQANAGSGSGSGPSR